MPIGRGHMAERPLWLHAARHTVSEEEKKGMQMMPMA
jgi:hypothetical protein